MTTHRHLTLHRDPDPNLPAAGREGGAVVAPAMLRTSRLSLARSASDLRLPAITAG